MKRILKLLVLTTGLLLVFNACEKDGEVRQIQKTWKVTLPTLKSSAETKAIMPMVFYITFSNGGLTFSQDAKNIALEYGLPEYESYLLIVGHGAYSIEATSASSGKLYLSLLEDEPPYIESFMMYDNLKSNSLTLVLPGGIEFGEFRYTATAVKNPKFITMEEFMSNYDGPQ